MPQAGRERALADLRARIERLALGRSQQAGVLPFGLPAVDAHLPGGGLQRGALHEVSEAGPAAAEHAALAALFVAGILARIGSGPVLWCLRGRDLFAPALARAGLPGCTTAAPSRTPAGLDRIRLRLTAALR